MPTIGNIGDELDLLIRQGATFRATATLRNPDATPVNLTDAQVRGQIRKAFDSANVVATFDTMILDPLMGRFEFSLSPAVTSSIAAANTSTAADSRYVYDLELVDSNGGVTPLTYGIVSVFREITR